MEMKIAENLATTSRQAKLSRMHQQKVRARKYASDDENIPESASTVSDLHSDAAPSVGSDSAPSIGTRSALSTAEEKEQQHHFLDAQYDEAATLSFGALIKAQETVDGPSTAVQAHGSRASTKQDGKAPSAEANERRAGKKDKRDFVRASKHAPTELSSKKAVSRKREVVQSHKLDCRDPRFEATSGLLDGLKTKQNYAFLNTYRDSEISELKSTLRETKDLDDRQKLKRTLLAMESRKQTQEAKDKEQEILKNYRKEEKVRVSKGKKPFYLKKGEQKQLALLERFAGMKGAQVDKVIERRRKKQTARTRRDMPEERRS